MSKIDDYFERSDYKELTGSGQVIDFRALALWNLESTAGAVSVDLQPKLGQIAPGIGRYILNSGAPTITVRDGDDLSTVVTIDQDEVAELLLVELNDGSRVWRSRVKAAGIIAGSGPGNVFWVLGGQNDPDASWEFNTQSNAWTLRASNTRDMLEGAATSVNAAGYQFGGNSPANSTEVSRYIPQVWTQLSAAPTGLQGHGASGLSGKSYVSGWNADDNGCREHDPVGDSWVTRSDMNIDCALGNLEESGGKLYAIGGGTATNNRGNSCQEFDEAGNSWTTLNTSPTQKRRQGSFVLTDFVYRIQGESSVNDDEDKVERFSTVANSWVSLNDHPAGNRDRPSAAAAEGVGYSVGGFSGSQRPETYEYNPVGDSWTAKADLTLGMGTARNQAISLPPV